MYESLTNSDCFSKPFFNYDQFVKKCNEGSIIAPNDAFKPVDDSDDETPPQTLSRREERLHYGRDFSRIGFRQPQARIGLINGKRNTSTSKDRKSSRRKPKQKKQPVIDSFFDKFNIF